MGRPTGNWLALPDGIACDRASVGQGSKQQAPHAAIYGVRLTRQRKARKGAPIVIMTTERLALVLLYCFCL